MEFLDTFEQHSLINCKKPGKLSLDEFIEYYTNVSVGIQNDEYFQLIINNAWNLSGSSLTYQNFGKGIKTSKDDDT
jgi:hypothetical protein